MANGQLYEIAPLLAVEGSGAGLRVGLRWSSGAHAMGRRSEVGPGWAVSYVSRWAEATDFGTWAILTEGGELLHYVPPEDGGAHFVLEGRPLESELHVDGSGRVRRVDRGGYEETYDADGALTSMRDASGRVITIQSYEDGTGSGWTRIEDHSDGSAIDLIYVRATVAGIGSDTWRLQEIRDVPPADAVGAIPRIARLGYDLEGRLVEIHNAEGDVLRYAYDVEGRMTHRWNRNQAAEGTPPLVTTYLSAADARVAHQMLGSGTEVAFRWTDGAEYDLELVYQPGTSEERAARIAHDDEGRIVRLGVANAAVFEQREYDGDGHLSRRITPEGRVTAFVHDASHDLIEAIEAPGTATALSTRYHYDAAGRVLREVSPGGAEVRYERDARGLVTALHSLGACPGGATLCSESDRLSLTRRFSYDSFGRLIMIEGEGEQRTCYVRDARGRVVRVLEAASADCTTSELGLEQHREVDWLGRVTRTVSPTGLVSEFDLRTDGQPRAVVVRDPSSGRTRRLDYEYTRSRWPSRIVRTGDGGRAETWRIEYTLVGTEDQYAVSRVERPDGNVLETRYDAYGTPVATFDASLGEAADRTFEHVLDASGTRWTVRARSGRVLAVSRYDHDGLLVSESDGRGVTTRWEHDELGRVTRVIDGAVPLPDAPSAPSLTTEFTYDTSTGALRSRTEPSGESYTYVHDGLGRVVRVTSSSGLSTATEYHPNERRVRSLRGEAGSLEVLDTIRDRVGRVVERIVDPEGVARRTRSLYAMAGTSDVVHLQAEVGPNVRHDWRYDAFGQLVEAFEGGDAATAHRYAYDGLGRLQRVYDARGRERSFEHDRMGRTVAVQDDWGTERRVYGAGDRLLSSTDVAGRVTGYEYDVDGRLVSERSPDGSVVRFEYDAADELARVIDATGVTSFARDAAGRVVRRERNGDALTYRYDRDRLLAIGYPELGEVRFERDALGRVSRVDAWGEGQLSYGYDSAGRLGSIRRLMDGGELLTQHERRPGLGELDGLVTTLLGSPLSTQRVAERDAGGRIVRLVERDADGPERSQRFSFDDRGRLANLTEAVGGATTTFTMDYDVTGNRTRLGDTVTRFDELDRVEGFEYDLAGNVIFDGTTRYAYDTRNRLVRSERTGFVVEYEYDGLGLLVAQSTNGHRLEFLYDQSGALPQLAATREPDGTLTAYARSLEGWSARVTRRSDGTRELEHPVLERMGSVRAWVASDGDVTERRHYDAWGVEEDAELEPSTGGGATLTLVSRREYEPVRFIGDERTLAAAARVTVPDTLQVTEGNAGNHWARLRMVDTDGVLWTVCYRGGSSQAHPLGEAEIEYGRRYTYHRGGVGRLACDRPSDVSPGPALYAGDSLAVVGVELKLLGGSDRFGPTQARVTLTLGGSGVDPGDPPVLAGHLGYTGEWTNPDGTLFLRARVYAPQHGRFLQRDPFRGWMTRPSSQNRYTYVENDPIHFVDPTGYDAEPRSRRVERDGRPGDRCDYTSPLQNLSDLASGVGSGVTFGLTDQINRWLGNDPFIQKCSWFRRGGEVWGDVARDVVTGDVRGFRDLLPFPRRSSASPGTRLGQPGGERGIVSVGGRPRPQRHQRARHHDPLPNGGRLTSWDRPMSHADLRGEINELRRSNPHARIDVLSGTHGVPDGRLVPQVRPDPSQGYHPLQGSDFLREDIAGLSQNGHDPYIRVFDTARMSEREVQSVLESGHCVLAGWCYSTGSRLLRRHGVR